MEQLEQFDGTVQTKIVRQLEQFDKEINQYLRDHWKSLMLSTGWEIIRNKQTFGRNGVLCFQWYGKQAGSTVRELLYLNIAA